MQRRMSVSEVDTYASTARSGLTNSLAALRLAAAVRDFNATVATPGSGVFQTGSTFSKKGETKSSSERSQHDIVEQLGELIAGCWTPSTFVPSERPEKSLYWLGGGASSRQRQIALETLRNVRRRSQLQVAVATYEAQLRILTDIDDGEYALASGNVRWQPLNCHSYFAVSLKLSLPHDEHPKQSAHPTSQASRLAVEARVEAALYTQCARHGRLEVAVQQSEKHLRSAVQASHPITSGTGAGAL
eukprot:6201503-Pleurochrysis_carterae.AAC.1